jgi:hypothetical protein
MLPGVSGFHKPARDSNPESPDDSARDDCRSCFLVIESETFIESLICIDKRKIRSHFLAVSAGICSATFCDANQRFFCDLSS